MRSHSERGFTLIETIVAVAIGVVLLVAGGIWLLGMHPGALAQATDDYDAALSRARAIAQSSGNGATLVFAPRAAVSGVAVPAGFALRVYSGRPSSANAVTPTTVMPVVSDATIAEAKLGKPPFAIFIGASGDVSGRAGYPAINADGAAKFTAIATEPECPAAGFIFTFTSPQGVKATRTLPCIASQSAEAGNPNPSPTPNVPIVTPALLVYHWPAAPEQTFVATEWGYTHWFASTAGFTCGDGVATFPDVLPDPYSDPSDAAESTLAPAPPADEPFSYPNAGGGSTNDAPALFRLDAAAAGLCTPTVRDEFEQRASTSAQVMGWLTVTYGGKSYTHLTTPSLDLGATALQKAGATVTLPVSKTYDAEALQLRVDFANPICTSLLAVTANGGTTPATPSKTAATASLALQLTSMPGAKTLCGGTIYDQYNGSEAGEGVPFDLTLQSQPPQTWPKGIQYPSSSGSGQVPPVGSYATCPKANQPRAFDGQGFGASNVVVNGVDPGGSGLSSDASGCLDYKGNPVDMTANPSMAVDQPGYADTFLPDRNLQNGCSSTNVQLDQWTSQNGPTGLAVVQGGAATQTPCYVAIEDVSGAYAGDPPTNANEIEVEVANDACGTLADGSIYVPVGATCGGGPYSLTQPNVCVEQGEEQLSGFVSMIAVFGNPPTPGPLSGPTGSGTSAYGTIVEPAPGNPSLNPIGGNTFTFTRTAPGPVTVTVYQELADLRAEPGANGNPEQCTTNIKWSVLGTITYE